ncbi:MAG: Fe-S cluster assembly protein SufD [Chloroflexota bacterium]
MPPVVTRTRKPDLQPASLPFTADLMPTVVGRASFLDEYRRRAWAAYEALPLPTQQEEAWRRTDIRALLPRAAEMSAFPPAQAAAIPAHLLAPLTDASHGGQLVFSPDGVRADVSPELAAKGVVFTDLLTAERQHPQLLANVLGQIVRADEGKFAALASALASQGVLVYVPRGVQLEQPLHSLLWGPGGGRAYFSHLVVWVEAGASLTYVHEAASPTEAQDSLHAGVVEIHVAEGANLRFVELQSWGEHVWNFSHERAHIGRDATLDWVFGAIGSKLTKNFSDLDLIGEGGTGRMSGFYFTDGTQHLDHDTQQNHLVAHTTSDLLFKGALKDRSRSVWQGMIYVAPGAQKTDGYQANRNLVLDKAARADSIPGLEILADDVRCTHGATVGKIDSDQVFYLKSRGVPGADAERLIVEGFFDPIMQRIPFEGVRQRFQDAIQEKLG